jgi:ribonuclease Z
MEELNIHFLGTGSARPSLRRNTAAVVLTYGGDALLFDCGEGTQVQFVRAGIRTSRLRAICLSHFHGDHLNGLPGLIGTMGLNGHNEPLTIVAGKGIRRYFKTLRSISALHPSFPLNFVDSGDEHVISTPKYQVRTCRLRHRVPCRGYLFEEFDLPGRFQVERAEAAGVPRGPMWGRLQDGENVTLEDGTVVTPDQVLDDDRPGRKVAYITDTMPSDEVVDFVRGADVLIHESTYLHEFADQAAERGHSTARQAAEVARAADVGRLILTHISTKHIRNRPMEQEAREVFPESVLANDLDSFTVEVPG